MAQRISRAKATIGKAGATFALPSPEERPARLAAVLKVLYLVFTEGHDATAGPDLARVDLCQEAIRLTRMLALAAPDDGEVLGLLALMLLTEARRPARVDAAGGLVPLAEQDRNLWDRDLVEEGSTLVVEALSSAGLGPYQVQAAIAAVHAEAPDTEQHGLGADPGPVRPPDRTVAGTDGDAQPHRLLGGDPRRRRGPRRPRVGGA